MTEEIYKGAFANDGTGTPARPAADIINGNFNILDGRIKSIQNPNEILKQGDIETDALDVHVDAGAFQWRIDLVEFLDAPEYDTVLNPATDGYYRTDVLLGNDAGGYNIFQGTQDPVSAPEPTVFPVGTIKLGVIHVFGASVTGTVVDVAGFITKESKSFIRMFYAGNIDSVPVDIKSYLKFEEGMLSLKSLNIADSNNFYFGKSYIIKNGTSGNVTLFHNQGTGNFIFNIPNGQDLILKPEESAHFIMRAINYTNNGGLLDYVGVIVDLAEYYTKGEIDSKISSVYKYKGNVANYAALPSSGQTVGDVYNALDTGHNYAWTGTLWDDLGPAVDISGKEDSVNKSNSIGDFASSIKFPVWSAIVSFFSSSQIKTILGISTLSGSNTGDETTATLKTKIDECLSFALSDETTNLIVGNLISFRMPYAMTLSEVRISVNDAPTVSSLIVDVKESGVSIFSTLVSIDASELTSVTAATPAVISDPNLADDALITINTTQIGGGNAGKGLKLLLKGKKA